MEIYKIKHPTEEKYSSGVRYQSLAWSKKGKTWNSIGFIKSHLQAVKKFDRRAFVWYKDWLVLKLSKNGIEEIGKVKDYITL